jgi:hydrogenase maturation protease
VEEMLGYDRVIIIDSIESKDKRTGQIREFSLEQFKETEQAIAPHMTNFGAALALYRKLEPSKIPSEIRIITISIEPKLIFSEEMSEPVRAAATELVKKMTREVRRTSSQSR